MRVALVLLVLIVGGVSACTALLPERYAVNPPSLRSLLGAALGQGEVPGEPPSDAHLAERIDLPEGFAIGTFAEGVRNARFMRFTSAGDLLVSSPREGAVILVARDADGDGRSEGTAVLIGGLDRPHGLDLRDGWLYVGEGDRVRRWRFDATARSTSGEPEPVVSGLPNGGNHWTKTVRFGPDGKLYVSVGSSCNVCIEEDARRAAIVRYEADGSGEEIFAGGLRNAVGFDWQPGTGALYATDNGRDFLGDDTPPCELNRVERGGFYGWPFAYGERVPDPSFGAQAPERVAASVAPAHGFVAHTAPLGMTFYRGSAYPAEYRGAAFVALHGSWNRTRKSGYSVVVLDWDDAGKIRERDFAVGWERDEDVIGRPVDVAEGPDGALYVSDDFGGVIYRIAYGG